MDVINAFPGYEFVYSAEDKQWHNMYRGEDVGKGGYVYARPGMYGRTVTFDVSSQHPSSIIAMNCFGEYTKNFKELLDARIAIKHKDFDAARKMMGGKLAPYLTDENNAKALAQALKISINSVYGLTAANFDTPFRDVRNKNNIVALRGALFMCTLKDEVIARGFTPISCKTDSIKIVNPDEEITNFVMEFGKKYGYSFEIEHAFERICLVNKSTFIARLDKDDPEDPGKWSATGDQFAVPYVLKKLFSKEDIIFEDLCEVKEVKSAMYLDMNEKLPEGEHDYRFIGRVGNFCPIKPGYGGGELLREATDSDGNIKYDAVTGTKGYRWLEAEMVKNYGMEDAIDLSYYNSLVDAAIETISEFGDFEQFVSDDPIPPIPAHANLVDPPWRSACGKQSCIGCDALVVADADDISCKLGHDVSDLKTIIDEEFEDDTFSKR